MKINKRILGLLKRALAAAKREECACDQAAQAEMALYLDTWVVAPLAAAIEQIEDGCRKG